MVVYKVPDKLMVEQTATEGIDGDVLVNPPKLFIVDQYVSELYNLYLVLPFDSLLHFCIVSSIIQESY